MACIARDNALDYLIKKGAINDTRKILDISLFILIIFILYIIFHFFKDNNTTSYNSILKKNKLYNL